MKSIYTNCFPKLQNIKKLYIPLLEHIGGGEWNNTYFEEIYLPNLKTLNAGSSNYGNSSWIISSYIKRIYFPLCEEFVATGSAKYWWAIARECPNLEEILLPSSKRFIYNSNTLYPIIGNGLPKLKKLVLGPVEDFGPVGGVEGKIDECIYLIHFELNGLKTSMTSRKWNPTVAYLTDSASLVEDDSICDNNLEQFLYNFRERFVKGLAPQTSKKYVYLHSKVLSYVFGEDESHYAANWKVPGESDFYTDTLDDELAARNWGLGA